MIIRTERLLLRRFRDEDRDTFAEMNDDARVMEHFVSHLTREQSDAFVDRIEQRFEERGYSLWAVEVVGRDPFIGFVGLWDAEFAAPFTPAIEVGWRLKPSAWGHGYATEAATCAIDDGFRRVGIDEIVSFTAVSNRRSLAVMERLGMVRDPEGGFDHPAAPPGHPVRPHVLYRFPDVAARRQEAFHRRGSSSDWRMQNTLPSGSSRTTQLSSPL